MPTLNINRTFLQTAVILMGGALLSADAAWLHMRELAHTYGEICGSGFSTLTHCPDCYVSASFLVASVAAVLLAHVDRTETRIWAWSSPSA